MSEEREFPLGARKKILAELSQALDKLQGIEAVRKDRSGQEALVLLAQVIGYVRFFAEVPRKGRP
jgi:cell division protein FtsX